MKFSRNAVTQTNHKPLFGSSLKGRIRQSRGNSPDLRIDPPPIGDPYAHCSDRSPSCPVDLQCSRLRSGRVPNADACLPVARRRSIQRTPLCSRHPKLGRTTRGRSLRGPRNRPTTTQPTTLLDPPETDRTGRGSPIQYLQRAPAIPRIRLPRCLEPTRQSGLRKPQPYRRRTHDPKGDPRPKNPRKRFGPNA